jgi:hypothetical protein
LVSLALPVITVSEEPMMGVSGVAATVGRWIDTGIKLPNPRPSLDCVILVRSSGVLAMGFPYVMFHVEHVGAEKMKGQRGNRIGELLIAAQTQIRQFTEA